MNILTERKCEACSESLVIDFEDFYGMTALMDKYPNCEFFGRNEHGESTQTSIGPNRVMHITHQNNLYRRVNTFYRDGVIEEWLDGSERENFRKLDSEDRELIRRYMDEKKVSLRAAYERYLEIGRSRLEREVRV